MYSYKMRKVAIQIERKKIRRKGVHAKSKTSQLKSSKNYKKLYRGQGWEDLKHQVKQVLKVVVEVAYVRIILILLSVVMVALERKV